MWSIGIERRRKSRSSFPAYLLALLVGHALLDLRGATAKLRRRELPVQALFRDLLQQLLVLLRFGLLLLLLLGLGGGRVLLRMLLFRRVVIVVFVVLDEANVVATDLEVVLVCVVSAVL